MHARDFSTQFLNDIDLMSTANPSKKKYSKMETKHLIIVTHMNGVYTAFFVCSSKNNEEKSRIIFLVLF